LIFLVRKRRVTAWFLCGFLLALPLPRTFVLDPYVYYRIHQKRVLGLSVSLVPYLHQKRGGMSWTFLCWAERNKLISNGALVPASILQLSMPVSLLVFLLGFLWSLPFGCAFSFLTLTDGLRINQKVEDVFMNACLRASVLYALF
jgi:hypothetical protein